MSKNFDCGQRLEAILTGALTTWRIDGKVGRNVSGKCTVETERTTITVARITDDGDTYWEVTPSGSDLPPLPFSGIQGMLRAVREAADADETGKRLVIGPQGDD